jgi:hypothetical protein
MLRCVSSSATEAAELFARRIMSCRAVSVFRAAPCSLRLAAPSTTTRLNAMFGSNLNSFPSDYRSSAFRRSFSSGDDDEDGATTDFASALETFWSPAVQQQLQAVAAGLPAVQDNLSSLSPGGPEYVKQMRRVETLATLERMLQALAALQADSRDMEALAAEATAGGDAAMGDEAQSACKKLMEEAKGIKLELLKYLVPHDDADGMDAVLELRAGVGGGEAALWCSDMCSMCAPRSIIFLWHPDVLPPAHFCNTLCMYQRFCEQKGWTFDVVSSASTESGGLREVWRLSRVEIDMPAVTAHMQVVCTISGSGAFGMLRFESGVHRVQRVAPPPRARRCRRVVMAVLSLRLCSAGASHREDGPRAHVDRHGGGDASAAGERSSN